MCCYHNKKNKRAESRPSESTQQRARAASIELVDVDQQLVSQSDYILSIVPPRDALSTAKKINDAIVGQVRQRKDPLYYIDLNAVSPNKAHALAALFDNQYTLRFVDGGVS